MSIPRLHPYDCMVKTHSGTFRGFRDWFADDSDAAATSRAILTEQGYTIASVTVEPGKVIVTIS